jgi:electron transfer flavoprotein beta subunit
MAMGVDRGVLVTDPRLKGSDTLATSWVLAAALKALMPFDLVLFGMRSADSDTGQVGPQTAVLLDFPLVTAVHSIERGRESLLVSRSTDGFLETFDVRYPLALTVAPAFAAARDLGLQGLKVAFEEDEIEKWRLEDLDLSPGSVGDLGSPTKVISLARRSAGRKCRFIAGSIEEQAEELLGYLKEKGLIT